MWKNQKLQVDGSQCSFQLYHQLEVELNLKTTTAFAPPHIGHTTHLIRPCLVAGENAQDGLLQWKSDSSALPILP